MEKRIQECALNPMARYDRLIKARNQKVEKGIPLYPKKRKEEPRP